MLYTYRVQYLPVYRTDSKNSGDRKTVKTNTCENISKTPAKIKQPIESQKSPSIAWMQLPPVPMGEDKYSFDCFSSQLRDEAKRKKPRHEVTSKLMEAINMSALLLFFEYTHAVTPLSVLTLVCSFERPGTNCWQW